MEHGWTDLGGGSFVTAASDARARVNTGLVVGRRRALVIDTGCGPRHGAQLLAAVRRVTGLPLVVVNTHAHWDHFFGNAVFKHDGVTEFWAHPAAARAMAEMGEKQRGEVAAVEPEMAAGVGKDTQLVPPTRLVAEAPVSLDLGGVSVELFWPGAAHTPGDLMVGAPGVLFAGDVVEEGAPPSLEPESSPAGWIAALDALAGLGERYPVIVPGHGRPVGPDFAAHMAAELRGGG